MRKLRPMFRDDLYSIGCEALSNAFRHAAAQAVEAELLYRRSELRVYVRDDGRGFAPSVLAQRVPGGIRRMQRLAKRAGARLEVRTLTNAGTEVELRIPSSLAYAINR